MSKISGFYYDHELNNVLLNAALYPNKILKENYEDILRIKALQIGKDFDGTIEKELKDYPLAKTTLEAINKTKPDDIWEVATGDNTWSDGYSKNSIATAIFTDDFSIDVGNSWSDVGGDTIGQLWNGARTMSPYISAIGSFLTDVGDQTQKQTESIKGKDYGKEFVNKFGKAMSKAGSFTSNLGKLSQRGLNVLGTSFTYYSGSAINFGALGMKYTALSQIEGDEFVSVFDHVRKILPYIVGPFIPVDVKEFGADFGTEASNFVKEFAFWQMAPGGFEPDMRNVDIAQKGTLKLRLGSYYSIPSLVIAGAQFNFSRQMVKNPKVTQSSEIKEDYLVPLSCEVSLTLKPATKYSYNALVHLLKGAGTKELRTTLANEMRNSYDDVKMLVDDEINCLKSLYV